MVVRIAVVSDSEPARAGITAFALVVPGRLRAFHNRDLDDARRWISE
jgi:hypothetical protein